MTRVELPNYLPWETLLTRDKWVNNDTKVEICIVLQKDGCLQQTYGFRGQDLESCSASYINGVSAYFNETIKRLGDGWMVSVEAQRFVTQEYPESEYENLAAYLIDCERKESFQAYGEHYDSSYYITFVYKPEAEIKKQFVNLFLKDSSYERPIKKEIDEFLKITDNMTGILQDKLIIRPLDHYETFLYLHSTCSMSRHPFVLPKQFMFLDSAVSDMDIDIGMTCKLGKYFIPILVIKDFPMETYPAILNELNKQYVEYRWVSRYFPLSKPEAMKELEKWQKKHFAGRKSMKQYVAEMTMNYESQRVNQGAVVQQGDVENAQAEVETDLVGLGYYNTTIMVWDEDYNKAMVKMKTIRACVESCGFSAKEETSNAFAAFLGMVGGDVYWNIRRPLVSTGNYAHVLPLSAIWAGLLYNKFTNEVCGVDAPLVTCSTNNGTPFFLNLNEGDVGHTLVFGPTGAGKSTLLNLLEASFPKYPEAQVFILDKGKSALTLTLAVGGEYINPSISNISFQPLADIDKPEERLWAIEFIETLLTMQGVQVDAKITNAISITLDGMSDPSYPKELRTLTTFKLNCVYYDENNKNPIDDGLTPYTLKGPYGKIFDGDKTTIGDSSWIMMEMEALMEMKEKVVAPAIMYIFHFLEKRFLGRLTLFILDEAWVFLDHPIFEMKMKEWLKTLRKKNVFCVFATQEVADAANSKIASTLIQNCPTKIFLADPKAIDLMEYYRRFGLTDEEIAILSMAKKKRDYYYKSTMGTRLFQLNLGVLTLAMFRQQQDKIKVRKVNGEEEVLLWADYCEFLISQKEKHGLNQGLVKQILAKQGIEYEKYIPEGLGV